VRACPTCRQAWETLQAIQTELRRPELRVSAPAGLRQQIQARLEAERNVAGGINPWRRRPTWIPVAAVVAVLVSLALLWLAQPFGNPRSKRTRIRPRSGRPPRAVAGARSAPGDEILRPRGGAGAARGASWLSRSRRKSFRPGFSLAGARARQVGDRKAWVRPQPDDGSASLSWSTPLQSLQEPRVNPTRDR
jgi:hypothetical protein